MQPIDISGKLYSRLIAIKLDHIKNHVHYWLFKCCCGKELVIRKGRVMSGKTKSCGCISSPNPISYTPPNSRLTFIRQTVSYKHSRDGIIQAVALYKCSCGNEKEIKISQAKRGHVKSCGCLINEPNFIKHGMTNHPLYKAYIAIKDRCYRSKHRDFQNYGGRGVVMCEEWFNNPSAFLKWGLENGWEKGLQVDKDIIAKKLGVEPLLYSPDRCQFVTPKTNGRTKRGNRYIQYKGITKTLMEWSEDYNINYRTLKSRFESGWSTEQCFYTPVDKSKSSNK